MSFEANRIFRNAINSSLKKYRRGHRRSNFNPLEDLFTESFRINSSAEQKNFLEKIIQHGKKYTYRFLREVIERNKWAVLRNYLVLARKETQADLEFIQSVLEYFKCSKHLMDYFGSKLMKVNDVFSSDSQDIVDQILNQQENWSQHEKQALFTLLFAEGTLSTQVIDCVNYEFKNYETQVENVNPDPEIKNQKRRVRFWLERYGIATAKTLMILTPQMADMFISYLYAGTGNVRMYYKGKVLHSLLIPMIDIIRQKDDHPPNIDKSSLVKMIGHFFHFYPEKSRNIYRHNKVLTTDQFTPIDSQQLSRAIEYVNMCNSTQQDVCIKLDQMFHRALAEENVNHV